MKCASASAFRKTYHPRPADSGTCVVATKGTTTARSYPGDWCDSTPAQTALRAARFPGHGFPDGDTGTDTPRLNPTRRFEATPADSASPEFWLAGSTATTLSCDIKIPVRCSIHMQSPDHRNMRELTISPRVAGGSQARLAGRSSPPSPVAHYGRPPTDIAEHDRPKRSRRHQQGATRFAAVGPNLKTFQPA